jgi:threonine synthase
MNYISTRGNFQAIGSAEAIVKGMVPAGGLFVPEKIPETDILSGKSYQDTAFEILCTYLCSETDYSEEEIREYINSAYNASRFDDEKITPLHFLDENTAVLELWHGPTSAFKDMALQIMPYLMTGGLKILKHKKEIVILVATSGDTGKAALEGFKDVPGTRIIVFYPAEGVSRIQEMQMLTTGGRNTYVTAVKGNFDDCQKIVKEIFSDEDFNSSLIKKGYELSSANSINWGRLVPQIVYYFHAYFQMLENKTIVAGDKIDFCVPTGNFGNILAAFYAREMGLPVNRLICASNINNVLTDFIRTGHYDKKRDLYKTSSPSMDILISSNLERFLFSISGDNPQKIVRWYGELQQYGDFKVDDMSRQRINNILFGDYATEEETAGTLKRVFNDYGYLIDTHTAVGMKVLESYRKSENRGMPAVVCGTASPFKFNSAVYSALKGITPDEDEFITLKKLKILSGAKIPKPIENLENLKKRQRRLIETDKARDEINKILGLSRKVSISLKGNKKGR